MRVLGLKIYEGATNALPACLGLRFSNIFAQRRNNNILIKKISKITIFFDVKIFPQVVIFKKSQNIFSSLNKAKKDIDVLPLELR